MISRAVHLKWTDGGVKGIQNLIAEINKLSYMSLEVLDLSGIV